MARTIMVYIDDETEARLLHAQKHHDVAGGASLEWFAEAAVAETALSYAKELDKDPADDVRAGIGARHP